MSLFHMQRLLLYITSTIAVLPLVDFLDLSFKHSRIRITARRAIIMATTPVATETLTILSVFSASFITVLDKY